MGTRTDLEFQQATAQKAASGRAGLDVVALCFAQAVASDAVDSYSAGVITAASHSAKTGDIILFTSGVLDQQMFSVYTTDTNTITLGQTPSSDPSAADTFAIRRFSQPVVNAAGAIAVTVSSGSITADTELPAAAALADNTANPTAPAVGSFGHLWDGVTWDRFPGTSADGALVNLGANNDVTVTSVPAPLNVVGGGTEAAALRVTIASDSTGVVSVDDNGSTLSIDDGGGLISIDDGAGSITVDGSVTANAGTNLNTSLLALEAGGNLAGAATSLAVLDDWDESDRAKVNPIVGQAGIAAGAGAVGVTVPRITLASDDPAVTSVQIMDDWDESDRCKVNLIVGQAGVAAGSGAVGATTQRVILATDDPAVTSLATLQLLVQTEDGPHNSGDRGIQLLGVQKATPANLGADGDYGPLQISAGRLWASATIDAALPAGTNAIGKLAANSGVDIGDVDVTSIVPGTGATNLGKAEDAGHTTGDVGVFALGVMNVNMNAALGAHGDYTQMSVDKLGRLFNGGYAEQGNWWRSALTSDITDTTSTSVRGGFGATTFLYLCDITISNTDASVGTRVNVLDGATVIDTCVVTSLTGGNPTWTKHYDPPLRLSDNTALNIQCVTTSAEVRGAASGFVLAV